MMETSNQLRMRLCVESQKRVIDIHSSIQEKEQELLTAKDDLKKKLEAMLTLGSFDVDNIFVYDGCLFKVFDNILVHIKGVNLDREQK